MKPLSAREIEVLRLTCDGLNVKATANRLGISPKTVATHRMRICHKTNCSGMAQLGVWAVRNRIVELEPQGAAE